MLIVKIYSLAKSTMNLQKLMHHCIGMMLGNNAVTVGYTHPLLGVATGIISVEFVMVQKLTNIFSRCFEHLYQYVFCFSHHLFQFEDQQVIQTLENKKIFISMVVYYLNMVILELEHFQTQTSSQQKPDQVKIGLIRFT